MPAASTGGRRAYIDWTRGLAVLLMIEAHSLDAWTRPSARHSLAFGRAMVLGGFAAPLFLWLAGISMALSAARLSSRVRQRAPAVETICRRGLEVFLLAFLFRLQAFLVSPGSYFVTVFRVDILNIMGPALVAAGLLWSLSERPAGRSLVYAVAAATIGLVTPIVRASRLVDALPLWLQWYARPSGDYTTFTLFPWAGFVFAGAACGALLAGIDDPRQERRRQLAFAAAGVALVVLGLYTSTKPSIYAHSEFWSSSPTWFAIRVGVMMVGFSTIYGLEWMAARFGVTCRPLERFGRHSLFVYWIHVELVYGYLSWPWRAKLPFGWAVAACAVFSMLMYGAVALKDGLVGRWREATPAWSRRLAGMWSSRAWSNSLASGMSEGQE